jgi:hypothetical protein
MSGNLSDVQELHPDIPGIDAHIDTTAPAALA